MPLPELLYCIHVEISLTHAAAAAAVRASRAAGVYCPLLATQQNNQLLCALRSLFIYTDAVCRLVLSSKSFFLFLFWPQKTGSKVALVLLCLARNQLCQRLRAES